MPAHNLYNTLIDIWSGGCNPVLHYSLPILFAYEVSSFILASLGVHRRSHYAIIRAEAEQAAANERIEAAISLEKRRRAEDKARFVAELAAYEEKNEIKRTRTREEIEEEEEAAEERNDAATKKEIQSIIDQDTERRRGLQNHSFGPSFGFGFVSGGVDDGGADGAELGKSRTFGGRRTFQRKGSMV
jgi:hypothetical protein